MLAGLVIESFLSNIPEILNGIIMLLTIVLPCRILWAASPSPFN